MLKRAIMITLCLITGQTCMARTLHKKFIEYGWDCPDTAFYRENHKEMEKIPFDGVVLRVMKLKEGAPPDTLGWTAFSKLKFQPQDYEHAITDLKAVKSKRFTDNFIQVIGGGQVDWFDPEWPTITHNAACLARVAKQGGCKGIMFDPEQYDKFRMWTYATLPAELKDAHNYKEYQAKARERGREFIRAINKEFPDITILALFGPSLTHLATGAGRIEDADYSLLAAFYDGICEAATSNTTLIDGFEFAYSYRTPDKFAEGRKAILDSEKKSLNPKALRKHIRVGFGIWADCSSLQLGWHPEDFTKNYYTPAGLRASLNYGLETSDCYVWVYSERLRWWDEVPAAEYVDALRLAKTGPGPGEKNPLSLP